jgi:hypothetical protein
MVNPERTQRYSINQSKCDISHSLGNPTERNVFRFKKGFCLSTSSCLGVEDFSRVLPDQTQIAVVPDEKCQHTHEW